MKIQNTFHVNMFPCNERLRFTVSCVKILILLVL